MNQTQLGVALDQLWCDQPVSGAVDHTAFSQTLAGYEVTARGAGNLMRLFLAWGQRLLCRLLGPLVAASTAANGIRAENPKLAFWDQPRRGANFFNQIERAERFAAAKRLGIEFVRLAPSKWKPDRPDGKVGDFLAGPRDEFHGIPAADLAQLRRVLDEAAAAGVPVVLTTLSLPGCRFRQHNDSRNDLRLWTEPVWQDKAVLFWSQLAAALRDHPAVVGYNILNEPAPERIKGGLADWFTGDYPAWAQKVKGTPADLNAFYARVVRAIRTNDPHTPIIVDSGFYATPWAFGVLEPLADAAVLYSFHSYEPYAFTSHQNKGRYTYPGVIPIGESDNPPVRYWDQAALAEFLRPVADWQRRHRIPSARVLVGEFGVYRRNPGAAQYLQDSLTVFQQHRWHWAFYAFREDTWDGMDYELGTGPAGRAYWEAIQKGLWPPETVYRPNPLFDVLKKHLQAKPTP